MRFDETIYHIKFATQKDTEVTLSALGNAAIDFLEHFGEESLVGKAFYAIIGEGSGKTKFLRLLNASGYEDNPRVFFLDIIRQLEKANGEKREPIKISNITFPHLLLMSLLEKMIPGNKFISVKDVTQLENLTHVSVPDENRWDMQSVIETYPVRLSMHTIRQMRISKDVAYQYLPFAEELDPAGHVNTWIGQFHQGLLEQMYQNRVIFLLNMTCPVYCRFCFRKHKESRNQKNPTLDEIREAVEYVRKTPTVKEIVLTGGDPFLNKANLLCAIEGLAEVPHVQTLRIATRSIAYYPHLFYAYDSAWLNDLKIKNLELQQKGKRMEVATHFIHPDEISPESLDIISELVRNGIAVYVQTPFLKDCNDEGPELVRLFHLLRGAGAELHYIYIPCSPIQGNSVYWTPISKGLAVANYLRAHLSDRVIPRICTATAIGKMDWHTSGWAVEQDSENEHFIWLRTPYTPDYFKNFAPVANEWDMIRVNEEGTIDAKYMAEIGDEALFLGSRSSRKIPKDTKTDRDALSELQTRALEDQRSCQSLISVESEALFRTHKTRVEISSDADDSDIVYIKDHEDITDVLISSEKDAIECLFEIDKIVKMLRDIHHVNAVRLRSLKFNYAPKEYTRAVIEQLGNLNTLRMVNPLRLEIETQFLHSDEFSAAHAKLAGQLRNKGVTVYSNTPLLSRINDTPDEISRIAYKCRENSIEFHHLYVAGLPLQESWSEAHPIDADDVIDIGTRVRRDGSGREIPRYIIRTALGEADFGLTSKLSEENGNLWATLLPYDLGYYRKMDPEFSWPEGVRTDAEGRPVISVPGLKAGSNFLLRR